MVRHEAAEALGAIGLPSCVSELERFSADPSREVAETCELALGRIAYWSAARAAACIATAPSTSASGLGSRKEKFSQPPVSAASDSPYLSIDPVPPAQAGTAWASLRDTLLDENAPMFERYRALFAVRNNGGPEAAMLCAEALQSSGSALLKHELCYVLGQLQEAGASAILQSLLSDTTQHAMVRHEAAEALGSIADADSRSLLANYVNDVEPIVAEGCAVALDIFEVRLFVRLQIRVQDLLMPRPSAQYETSGAFEYCITK
jgi:deoxyhypusine monooxygenase